MTMTTAPASTEPTATAKAPASPKRATTAKKASPVKTQSVTAKKSPTVKAKRTTSAKAAKTAAPGKSKSTPQATTPVAKEKKVKVVRDSFTIPKNEFTQLGEMKKKALSLGLEIKKSELIRAGLMLLGTATDAAFKKALTAVPTLKTGRPGKG